MVGVDILEKPSYNCCMKKLSAIKMFGSVGDLASAYGCTRQAIYQWPEDLPQGIADRVLGAYVRSRAEGQNEQSPFSADPPHGESGARD